MDERERACDEEVLRHGADAEVYAEGILNACRFYLESPLPCVSGVTSAGLELVNELDRPIEALHQRAMRHMKAEKLRELIGLLEEVRAGKLQTEG